MRIHRGSPSVRRRSGSPICSSSPCCSPSSRPGRSWRAPPLAGHRPSSSPRMARARSRPSPKPSRWPRTATRPGQARDLPREHRHHRGHHAPRGRRPGAVVLEFAAMAPTRPMDRAIRLRHPAGRQRRPRGEPHRAGGPTPRRDASARSSSTAAPGDRGDRRRSSTTTSSGLRVDSRAARSRSPVDRPPSSVTARGTDSRGSSGSANSPTFEGNTMTAQPSGPVRRSEADHPRQHVPRWRGDLLADAGLERDRRRQRHRRMIFGYAGDDTIIRDNRIRGGGEPRDGRPGSAIGITGRAPPSWTATRSPTVHTGSMSRAGARPQVSGNTIRGSSSAAIIVDHRRGPDHRRQRHRGGTRRESRSAGPRRHRPSRATRSATTRPTSWCRTAPR